MKKLLSIFAVAGMTAIVACGPSAADLAAKAKADSTKMAGSLGKVTAMQKAKADSMAAVEAKKNEMEKMKADSMMKAAHEDSVSKKLIKPAGKKK